MRPLARKTGRLAISPSIIAGGIAPFMRRPVAIASEAQIATVS